MKNNTDREGSKQARSYPIRIDHLMRAGTKGIHLTILQAYNLYVICSNFGSNF